jgi:hypothetical protein
MGYRSEVVLALDAKLVPALMSVFAQCKATQLLCTQECDDLQTNYDGKGNWFMRWSGIKWYESYPEIAMLSNFIEALNCDDLSEFGVEALEDHNGEEYAELYRFVRLGEDNDDIEMMGHCFESIGISRSIHY